MHRDADSIPIRLPCHCVSNALFLATKTICARGVTQTSPHVAGQVTPVDFVFSRVSPRFFRSKLPLKTRIERWVTRTPMHRKLPVSVLTVAGHPL